MLAALVAVSTAAAVGLSSAPVGAESIERLLQTEARSIPGQFKISVPQTELGATLDGFSLTPAMGMTSWISFTPESEGKATAVGELALLDEEVPAAQRLAVEAGFVVTSVYHRYLREKPRTAFLGLTARGELSALTEAVRVLLAALQHMRLAKGLESRPTKVASSLDRAALEAALGQRGQLVDGILKFEDADRWLAFQGTMEKAAVSGRFTLPATPPEEFEITHRGDSVVWFWAVGPVDELAGALKPGRTPLIKSGVRPGTSVKP